jgi:hypothetical protein
MLHAPSLSFVLERLESSFYRSQLKERKAGGYYMEMLVPGSLYERVPIRNKVKLIGILFMHPESSLSKGEIIPRMGLYNERAGEFTDFYFAGYGAYWPQSDYPDQRPVTKLDEIQWLYSDRAFNSFRRDIESKTRWRYSGETDLILTTARFSKSKEEPIIDFSQCIICCLEQILRDNATPSIPAFFESIFRFGESGSKSTAYEFSDIHLLNTSKTSLLEWILTRVGMKAFYEKNRNLAIRDIAITA